MNKEETKESRIIENILNELNGLHFGKINQILRRVKEKTEIKCILKHN